MSAGVAVAVDAPRRPVPCVEYSHADIIENLDNIDRLCDEIKSGLEEQYARIESMKKNIEELNAMRIRGGW